jgi:hypothetical protein
VTRAQKRDKYLRATYGISQKIYLVMLKVGQGACWICLRKPKPGKNLNVDHCHKTGRVRGLLCFFCNRRLLGRGRENPEHHKRAAEYLMSEHDWRSPLV